MHYTLCLIKKEAQKIGINYLKRKKKAQPMLSSLVLHEYDLALNLGHNITI